jgi:hypothetical protein
MNQTTRREFSLVTVPVVASNFEGSSAINGKMSEVRHFASDRGKKYSLASPKLDFL